MIVLVPKTLKNNIKNDISYEGISFFFYKLPRNYWQNKKITIEFNLKERSVINNEKINFKRKSIK